MTHFGRITTKAAWATLLLLFALRAIAAPGLCAGQDAGSESYRAAAGIAKRGLELPATAAFFSTALDQRSAVTSGDPLEPGADDYCDNPVIAADAAMEFLAAEPSRHVDLAPGLQYRLCWPEPAIVGAVLRLSLSPPLVAWPTLAIAPRLHI